MQEGLSLSTAQTGDLAASNMTGYLILAVLGGVAASKFGERRVIILSLFVVGVGMIVTGVANSYRIAFIGRFFTGLGSGGANVPIMGVLAVWYSRERRGFASGIAVSGSSFALLVTGLVLPPLIRAGGASGWRHAWHLLAAGTFAITIVTAIALRTKSDGKVDRAKNKTTPRKHEWRALFRTKLIWILSAIYFAFGFSYVIYATFFAKALVSIGMSELTSGRLWSIIGAASIASGFIWGTISDRIGRRRALSCIYLLQAVSFLAFGLQQLGGGVAGYFVSALLFSLTAWSIPAVMAAAAGDIAGPNLASAAFGLVTLVFGFGQIFGPLIAGRLVEATGAYALPFLLASAVAISGAFCAFLFIPNRLVE